MNLAAVGAALVFGVLAALGTPSANAIVVAAGADAFASTDTLITFEGLADDVEITTQFAAQGLTVSGLTSEGRLFARTDLGFFFSPDGGTVATNFQGSSCVGGCGDTILDFSTAIIRAGFDIVTAAEPVVLSAFQLIEGIFVPAGSVTFAGSSTPQFVGVQDAAGFDRLIIDVVGTPAIGGASVANDLIFAPAQVNGEAPEPATLALLAIALAGLDFSRRRRSA